MIRYSGLLPGTKLPELLVGTIPDRDPLKVSPTKLDSFANTPRGSRETAPPVRLEAGDTDSEGSHSPPRR